MKANYKIISINNGVDLVDLKMCLNNGYIIERVEYFSKDGCTSPIFIIFKWEDESEGVSR